MKFLCVRTQQCWCLLVLAVAWFVLPELCTATVTFTNPEANLLIGVTNSKVRVGNASKIVGWTNRSVVNTFGNNASTAWPEGYANGTVVGQSGVAGVTAPARLNLVEANSNAITVAVLYTADVNLTKLARNTSNLLGYTARTFSSSILVLRSRADSSSLLVRTTSNLLVALGPLARTTSNATKAFYSTVFGNLSVPVADSVDGTQFVKYCTNHHVFHNSGNAWTVRGWVRFNDGFTIMPRASVIMDTLTTVSGAMDLRDTGTLILNNDLYLAHNVTLTNGGNIKGRSSSTGQANTIFMGGDLTLSSTTYARALHITGDWSNSGTSGDLIIDGCGHTLNIGDRAQIFVDSNITLTLRNMTIKTGPKSLNTPAIQLASFGSKLALDNVMFDLGADFQFTQGHIFIHDEVAVTGTSALVYKSPRPSYITSGATWSFESGTTFSIAPTTFTDIPYTAGTAASNNFIVFADASSALSLDNCSFKTTFTGLRLRSGMVLFADKVAVDTQAGVELNTTTPVTEIGSGVATANTPYAVAWSPNAKFLAVANSGATNNLQMYQLDPVNGSATLGGAISTGNTAPDALSWSPDGRFFAVANLFGAASTMLVYRFNGACTPTLVGSPVVTGASGAPTGVSFSPDGRFIAVVNRSTTTLQVYRFDGVSTPVLVGSNVTTSTFPYSVAWSPDNRFLAVGCYTGGQTLEVYRFNGNSSPKIVGAPVPLGAVVPSVSWSPDGRFLAAVTENGNLYIYGFNGSSTPSPVTSTPTGTGTDKLRAVGWSPDGRYLVFSDITARNIYLYRFDGSSGLSSVGSAISVGVSGTVANSAQQTVAWSPNGLFITAFNAVPSGVLHVFRCNFVSTPSYQQGFNNGLVFGNSALGIAYDANVQLLGGAVVKAKGMIKDDSV